MQKFASETLLAMFDNIARLRALGYVSLMKSRVALESALLFAEQRGPNQIKFERLTAAVKRHANAAQRDTSSEEEAVVHLELAGAFGDSSTQRLI
jgi:hypothetical protein